MRLHRLRQVQLETLKDRSGFRNHSRTDKAPEHLLLRPISAIFGDRRKCIGDAVAIVADKARRIGDLLDEILTPDVAVGLPVALGDTFLEILAPLRARRGGQDDSVPRRLCRVDGSDGRDTVRFEFHIECIDRPLRRYAPQGLERIGCDGGPQDEGRQSGKDRAHGILQYHRVSICALPCERQMKHSKRAAGDCPPAGQAASAEAFGIAKLP